MGTVICWWGQRSHIKVKGHLRSSCSIGWKCKSGLIWKIEVWLEPNLVYLYNMGTFICSCGQRSYTKVKGHLRSSCKIGLKCENGLIWKVEVRFEPNLVYWYNMGIFICSCSQNVKSRSKVTSGLGTAKYFSKFQNNQFFVLWRYSFEINTPNVCNV